MKNRFKIKPAFILCTLLSLNLVAQEEEFDGIKNQLSDKEAYEAQNYLHAGKAERIYNEKCDENKDKIDDCKNEDITVMNSTLDALVPAVSKVYAMILGMGAITGKSSGIKNTKNKIEKSDSKEEDRNDVCVYIPMATELVSTAMQASEQNAINEVPDKPETIHRTSLEKVARTHKARAKSATVQATGWFATTACYTAYVSTGSVFDFKMGLKMGGSALLGTFYTRKAHEHLDYARFIQGIADSMPGAGDCNPHSATHCFCQEEASQRSDATNYVKYCVPKEHQNKKNAATALTCVDSNLKADTECRCKATNSCFSETFKAMGAKLNFGNNIGSFYPNLNSITDGNYNGAALTAEANRYGAIGKQYLQKNRVKDLPAANLNKTQLNEAKLMADLGMPNELAAFVASQPVPGTASSYATSLNATSPKADQKKLAKEHQIVMYESGKSPTSGRAKNKAFDPFAMLNKKKTEKASNNVEVLDFAQKAQQEAEINQADNASIFDAISQRYRTSGRRNLQVE
ncbi:MAG: hypothetical protein JNM93_12530 [Bacteriovoracaceae bacterium]|nr:hypothetical protein [Bacteriovoracaceae bacterium]